MSHKESTDEFISTTLALLNSSNLWIDLHRRHTMDSAREVFKKELSSNDDHQSVWVKLFQVFLIG